MAPFKKGPVKPAAASQPVAPAKQPAVAKARRSTQSY